MTDTNQPPRARGKQLLSDQELATTSGVDGDELTQGHRHGNGLRVHRNYILVVSILSFLVLGLGIVIATNIM